MNPRISMIVHTASRDGFLANHGLPSYFAALLSNVARQTFDDVELVYVDAHHTENTSAFATRIASAHFRVKHVPIHPAHRYWFDRGNTFISAAKNTGILHADGELLVSFDDAEFLPPELLERYWDHHTAGRNLVAVHKRMRSIEQQDGLPIHQVRGDTYQTDHRWTDLRDVKPCQGGWAYAGTSFTLQDAFALNGFNEKMDGYKSLEDCEFGVRLTKLGRKLVVDPKAFLLILNHHGYTGITPFQAVENHGLLRCAEDLPARRANERDITDAQMQIIVRETLRWRKFDPTAKANATQLAVWKETPVFDLEAQWQELRNVA